MRPFFKCIFVCTVQYKLADLPTHTLLVDERVDEKTFACCLLTRLWFVFCFCFFKRGGEEASLFQQLLGWNDDVVIHDREFFSLV